MSRKPRLRGREVIAALTKAGFVAVRSKGSHFRLRHPDGRCTSIPVHAGEQIGPGLMSKILRDVEMASDEFARLL